MKRITIRDVSLREGLDVPDVDYSSQQKREILRLIQQAGLPEAEIVAPGAVLEDLEFARGLKPEDRQIKLSGLVYAYGPRCQVEIEAAAGVLDRVDLLMPVSAKRKPADGAAKITLLLEMLARARGIEVGVGFPHSTQAEAGFLQDIAAQSAKSGAARVTIYDTNGGANPVRVAELVKDLKKNIEVPLFFHGHNDLGLATANSLAAVQAGADGLDLSVNGLGDRAGNASLEQVAVCLHREGFDTGVTLGHLRALSRAVAQASGIPLPALAPVVGDCAFCHKSPSHLENPDLFEAFESALVGADRTLDKK